LGWYYLRIPTLLGIGQYTLYADLPQSGGLYRTSNVTYRGVTIGRVAAVEPTERGVRVTMSIGNSYQIPVDASANVHSVSAVGEQYLDLVSPGNPGQFFSGGQTITKSTIPSPIGPTLDNINRGLEVLPKEKIDSLLDETSQAVGGLGPSLQRLVDATQAIVHDFKGNINDINDIIAHSAPIIDSQVNSGDAIDRWAANLNTLAAQTSQQDSILQSFLRQAAPTANVVTALQSAVVDSLPQVLANLAIVVDMLKRYHAGVEQTLVLLPQAAAEIQTTIAPYPGKLMLSGAATLNEPPPCMTGFLPASEWRSPADLRPAPLPENTYCKIPKEAPNVVRGARNLPCVDVPAKRAATPRECRSNAPYVPMGTNPWYGDPNQILTCPAPAARCDQPVDPGRVIPAPSVDNGMNPLPANLLPRTSSPPPTSDAWSPPGQGTVTCSGQQPNPCVYTPTLPAATYTPQTGEVVAPDGTKFTVTDSNYTGNDGWKDMLAPAG
jgi:phospholipid/cholesterol/gamma-HCH transport system substrate-binding protein